jgi:hypothetical protein
MWTKTEDLVCTSCAACCIYPWLVEVDEDHHVPKQYMCKERIRGVLYLDGDERGCCALGSNCGEYFCKIYSDRPQVCRDVQPGDAWCRKARRIVLKESEGE